MKSKPFRSNSFRVFSIYFNLKIKNYYIFVFLYNAMCLQEP